MENHTKRIRKSRREGQRTTEKEFAPPSRARFNRSPTVGQDLPGRPRANARKKSLQTTRKTKRQRPSASRRRTAPKMAKRA